MRRTRVSSDASAKKTNSTAVRFTAPRRLTSSSSTSDTIDPTTTAAFDHHLKNQGQGNKSLENSHLPKDTATSGATESLSLTDQGPKGSPHKQTRRVKSIDEHRPDRKRDNPIHHSSGAPSHFASRSSATVKARTVFYPPPQHSLVGPSSSLAGVCSSNQGPGFSHGSTAVRGSTADGDTTSSVLAEERTEGQTLIHDTNAPPPPLSGSSISPAPSTGMKEVSIGAQPCAAPPPAAAVSPTAPLIMNLLRTRQQGRTMTVVNGGGKPQSSDTATIQRMGGSSGVLGSSSSPPAISIEGGLTPRPSSSSSPPPPPPPTTITTATALPEGTNFFLKALEQIVQSETKENSGSLSNLHHEYTPRSSSRSRRSLEHQTEKPKGSTRSELLSPSKLSPLSAYSKGNQNPIMGSDITIHLATETPKPGWVSPTSCNVARFPGVSSTATSTSPLHDGVPVSSRTASLAPNASMSNLGFSNIVTATPEVDCGRPGDAAGETRGPIQSRTPSDQEMGRDSETEEISHKRPREWIIGSDIDLSTSEGKECRMRTRVENPTGFGGEGLMEIERADESLASSSSAKNDPRIDGAFFSPVEMVNTENAEQDSDKDCEVERREEVDLAYCPPADGPQLYSVRTTSQDHRIWLSADAGGGFAGESMPPDGVLSDPLRSISHASQQVLDHIHHSQIEWEEHSDSSTPFGSQFGSRVDGSGTVPPLFPSQQLQLQQLQQWEYMSRNSQQRNEEESPNASGRAGKERPSIEFVGLQTDNGAPLPPLCGSQEDLFQNPYYQRLVADLQQPHQLSSQHRRRSTPVHSSLLTDATSSTTSSSPRRRSLVYAPPSYNSTIPSSSLTPTDTVTGSGAITTQVDHLVFTAAESPYPQRSGKDVEDSSQMTLHPPMNAILNMANEEENKQENEEEQAEKRESFETTEKSGARTSYGLPADVATFYFAARGIRSLYPWQHEVLSTRAVRDEHRNFVYSLPTSGGKTLVAEVCLLRCVVQQRRSGMLVVPFVSIAEEKTAALTPLGTAFDFLVDGQYGTSGRLPPPPPKNGPITPYLFVCTIEKANSLLNFLLEEGRAAAELGVVVVDELHMLGEGSRGATLELFLSKLLVLSSRENEKTGEEVQSINEPNFPQGELVDSLTPSRRNTTVVHKGCQIIGMSATIPNLPEVAQWLRAECYQSDFRPVQLVQYCVIQGERWRDGLPPPPPPTPVPLPSSHFTTALDVVDQAVNPSVCGEEADVALGGGTVLSSRTANNLLKGSEVDQLYALATELPEDASVLIFCASRQQTVNTAKGLAHLVRQAEGALISSSSNGKALRANTSSVLPDDFISDMESHFSKSVASQLRDVLPFRVAFHHAGLLQEEREWIERAYVQRHIRWLCCTSTLAAGVNLPARRVLFRSPYVARDFLTASRYRQMSGRAGRAGLDAFGDSFLLLSQKRDHERGRRLLQAPPEVCYSQLLEEPGALQRAIMESVETGLVRNRREVLEWGKQLLCVHACRAYDSKTFSVASENGMETPTHTAQDGRQQQTAVNTDSTTLGPNVDCLESMRSTTPMREEEGGLKEREPIHNRSCSPGTLNALPSSSGIPISTLSQQLFESLDSLISVGLVHVSKPAASRDASHGKNGSHLAGNGTGVPDEGDHEEEILSVTPFGQSAVRSCFSVEEAMLVREEFDNLRRCGLILADDLHLCYFLTPLREIPNECDWGLYRMLLSRLSDDRQRIASLIGVDERFIDQRAMGIRQPARAAQPSPVAALLSNSAGGPQAMHCSEERRQHFIACRFFVALLLADVLAEVPMETLEVKYNVSRGQVQSLMRSASMFSSSMTNFCRVMEWYALEAVLASFVKRLGFGAKPDIVPLMELRSLTAARARALWNAGFKNIQSIADMTSTPEELVTRVKRASPPDSMVTKFFSVKLAKRIIQEAVCLQQKIS